MPNSTGYRICKSRRGAPSSLCAIIFKTSDPDKPTFLIAIRVAMMETPNTCHLTTDSEASKLCNLIGANVKWLSHLPITQETPSSSLCGITFYRYTVSPFVLTSRVKRTKINKCLLWHKKLQTITWNLLSKILFRHKLLLLHKESNHNFFPSNNNFMQ